MGREEGFQLLESLVVLAVLGLTAGIALPHLFRMSAGLRVDLAAGEVAGVLRQARFAAISRGYKVGVKFRGGEGRARTYTLYRDGDGDGILNRDIDSGVDPPVAPPRELAHLGRHIRFGFPPGLAPRDPGDPRRRLKRLDVPIRFNRSDIASFNPLGGSTPGSVYLTDSQGRLAVVRLFGRTGKVRVLTYDPRTERWR